MTEAAPQLQYLVRAKKWPDSSKNWSVDVQDVGVGQVENIVGNDLFEPTRDYIIQKLSLDAAADMALTFIFL